MQRHQSNVAHNAAINRISSRDRQDASRPHSRPNESLPGDAIRSTLHLPNRTRLRREDVLGLLALQGFTARRDLEQVLDSEQDLHPKETESVSAMLQNRNLREDWRKTAGPNVLPINGNSMSISRSPVSTVAAKVAYSVDREFGITAPGVYCLYWFCGAHGFPNDALASPQGMALHLLHQLVTQDYRSDTFDHEAISFSWRLLDCTRVRSIYHVLEALLKQLRKSTTVCIVIDGVCHYEDRARREDMMYLMGKFVHLAHAGERPCVKLLMTSVRTTKYIQNLLGGKDKILEM